jgi:P27 family predicted phage terminase small subunit
MPKNSDIPTAPRHLRPESADWWRAILSEYDLEPADLRVLETACVQWDRAENAREAIAACETGALVRDRFDQLKEHPAVAIEQNATRLFLAALRQLGLGMEPSSEPMRLPNPVGRRYREDD